MSSDVSRADILRPIQRTTKAYYVALGVASLFAGIWAIAWIYQLYHGLIVTGLSDWGTGGGVTWGMYIGLFIWWVGIAHGGIILSAAVRLIGLTRYQPVARLAELLTIGALMMAGLMIIVHLGRPDRVVWSVVLAFPRTIHTSPLIWDVTVITMYFVLTATYLALTLRYDVSRLRDDLPDRFSPVYTVLTLGYSEEEDPVVQRMVWWLALAIIILAPLLLHGGVIPWLFQLLPSMPGWYDSVQGPQFLTIALSSAISGVIILSYSFRVRYDWGHLLTDDIFRGLTMWLGLFVLLFLWLQLQQIISGVFAPPIAVAAATDAMLGEPLYWAAIGLAVLVLAFSFITVVRPAWFSKERAVLASVAILAATFTEKVLFIVEGMMYPGFGLYRAVPGSYFPSVVELSTLAGTIAMVAMFFLVVSKVIPVVELHVVEDKHGQARSDRGDGEVNQ
ncbi:polysulfide reductase NrfD [Halobacteria archaeon AArc-curdl1]|uniref:Polysulfide reductase NrfD n=1 Tax=Natronosalvus hydrolyticus TaxID=2979988 RepID=A0AAP2Z655_9EURY|nr:polysulfide reductase NrfD [Halobacteria archaeon AArc-curdl1]